LREPLDGLHHQTEKRESIVRGDLLHFKEIRQSGFALRFLTSHIQRKREIVDEITVIIQDGSL